MDDLNVLIRVRDIIKKECSRCESLCSRAGARYVDRWSEGKVDAYTWALIVLDYEIKVLRQNLTAREETNGKEENSKEE